MEAIQGRQAQLTNWTRSAQSTCFVYRVADRAGILRALAEARARRLPLIPHGAGHSYTDAALNTAGIVLDLTPMCQILAWDPARGIMRVEPGVTLGALARRAAPDGWWPAVAPSTPEVTIGGCAAMNVNGRNAWKCGPFGAHILALEVLLAGGETRTLSHAHEPELMRAVIGSLGLLGIITAITLQLQPSASGFVSLRRRAAASLPQVLALFAAAEPASDYMEAWLDGFASGPQLGRGVFTSASLCPAGDAPLARAATVTPEPAERSAIPGLGLAAALAQPLLPAGVRLANRARYERIRLFNAQAPQRRGLWSNSFWPAPVAALQRALCPQGVETFQAFVPRPQAAEIFCALLRYSQRQGCPPVWCIVKQHRRDPFLLSYQVDGFSLELIYARTRQAADTLEPMLRHMLALVLEAGGRFYLAKDRWQTAAQYRRAIGGAAVDAFLDLKQHCDPETRLQSDLYRRVFQPAA